MLSGYLLINAIIAALLNVIEFTLFGSAKVFFYIYPHSECRM